MSIRLDPAGDVTTDPEPSAGGGERNYFMRDLFASIVVIAAIIFGMEAWSWFAPVYIMPPPKLTGFEIIRILGEDYVHIITTILRLLFAVAFSLVIGSLIGAVMGMYRPAEPYLKSIIVIFTGVPALSWMLFAIFWFKGTESRVFFILGVILVPFYALNVYDGIKALSTDLIEVVETFRPSRWQVFRLLILPHVVPYILMTTKSIIGYAARMTAFAELVSVNTGMGARMGLAQDELNMEGVIGWTILLVIVNLGVQAIVAWAEKRLLKWRPEVTVR